MYLGLNILKLGPKCVLCMCLDHLEIQHEVTAGQTSSTLATPPPWYWMSLSSPTTGKAQLRIWEFPKIRGPGFFGKAFGGPSRGFGVDIRPV